MSDSMTDYRGGFKISEGRLFKDLDTGKDGGKGVRLHSAKKRFAQVQARVMGNSIKIKESVGGKSYRVDRGDLEAFLRRQHFLPQKTKEKIPKELLLESYEKFLAARVRKSGKEVPTDMHASQVRISDKEVVGNTQQFESLFSELKGAGFKIPPILSDTVKTQTTFSLEEFAKRLSPSGELKDGLSVLLYAVCLHGNVAAVKPLLDMEADPNIRDITGRTPLHLACLHGHHALLAPLMAGGANPFMRDESHVSPAQLIDAKKFPLLTKAWFEAIQDWGSTKFGGGKESGKLHEEPEKLQKS